MIAYLTGPIVHTGADHLILQAGGVGYLVFCAKHILERSQKLEASQTLALWIVTIVREDDISCYGFENQEDCTLFRWLLGIPGVGAKSALHLFSALSPQEILQAIQSESKRTLTQADGIGPKMAERIVLELKSKVAKMLQQTPLSSEAHGAAVTPQSEELFEVLRQLGYGDAEITATLRHIGIEAAQNLPLEDLIHLCLQTLGAGYKKSL